MQDQERTNVLAALQQAETKERPSLETMFEDVYDVKTPHLLVRFRPLWQQLFGCMNSCVCDVYQAQEREMLEHVAKYPDYYAEEH